MKKGKLKLVPHAADISAGSARAVAELHYEWMRERNYSDETTEARRGYLNIFWNWCEEREVTKLSQLSLILIERYQRHVYQHRTERGQPLSFSTQAQRLIHIREFCRWCARKRYLPYNPASEIDLPRIEEKLPQAVLTQEEVEKVLSLPDVTTPVGIRDRAILETLYSTGMRRAELSSLQIYDLDIPQKTVMIRRGKGKKDRLIPIGERAIYWLEKYLSVVRPWLVRESDPGNIFLRKGGQVMSPDCLTTGVVRPYIEKSGVGKKGACHLFRHAMATLMLDHGANLRSIQQILGHKKLSTTGRYTLLAIEKLKEIHSARHPGASLKPRESKDGEDPLVDSEPELDQESESDLEEAADSGRGKK